MKKCILIAVVIVLCLGVLASSQRGRYDFVAQGIFSGAGGHTVIGDAGSTSNSLNTNDDLFVTGKLEVDGQSYFDGSISVRNNIAHLDNVELRLGGGSDARLDWSTTQLTEHTLIWGLGDTSKSIIFCDAVDRDKDFDHAAQSNPTIFVHSATDPDYANDEWVSITHDVTDGVITTGSGDLKLSPAGNLKMDNDKLIAVDVNAGLTASTNQTQGQGALTAQVNEISTVANDGDTVTLPSAVTGIEIEIINNGANTLRIFPASGDDLGLGTGASTSFEELEANERVKLVAYDITNWAKESTTEIIHAEIHDEDNTDAFVVNAEDDFHSYHTNGLAQGDLADWAFDAGGAGTSHAIASIADGTPSGTDIAVTTSTSHGLAVGDIISQTNLTSAVYTGIFEVKDITSVTIYEVAAVYTATDTGTMDQAATLEADAIAAGVYSFAYYISATPVGANETFDIQLYKEATAVVGSKVRRKFGGGGDFGSMAGGGIVSVADGDKISFALSNEDSAANLTFRNLTIVLIRL